MYLRVACFVLFGLLGTFSCPAWAQSPAQPRDTASPEAPLPPNPESPAPTPAPTNGYAVSSTEVHAPAGADATPLTRPAVPGTFDLRDRRYADAHVDRVVMVPTAETHPEGTFYVSSYEIILIQAGYAISDRTQISLTTLPPLPQEKILGFDLSFKTVLVRAPEFRVAALGSVSGLAGIEEGTAVVGRAGGIVQLCLERTCRSNISLGTSVALAGPAIVAGTGAGVIIGATRVVSVLIEFDSLIPLGTAANEANGLAFASGIRLSGEHLGLDLVLARRIDVFNAMMVPFIAATYRTGP